MERIAFYSKYRSELLAQSILFVLSAAAYLWFFGSLRTWLERAEGGGGLVSAVAFGAGTVGGDRAGRCPQLAVAMPVAQRN